MPYDSTVREQVFKRLGLYVDWWYQLDAMKGLLDGAMADAAEKFDLGATASAQDKAAHEAISDELLKQKDELSCLRTGVAYKASEFIGVNVKALLDSPHSTPEAVLDHLIDAMGDYETGDCVLSNTTDIPENGKAEDKENSIQGVIASFAPTATQMARNDEFELTCIDDSTCNQERWQLESARMGQYSTDIISGQAADWAAAGLANINVPTTAVRVVAGDDKVAGVTISAAQRGVNADSDGRAWLKFNAAQALSIANDPLGQVSGFNLSDVAFGVDTDVNGKLYVSVSKEPAEIEVLGGAQAELADPVVTGAGQGILYAKVVKAASSPTYTVSLFTDADRQTPPMASGTSNDLGTITFNDGLSGQITLNAFNGPDGTDETIVLKLPVYAVRLYRAAGASQSNLVSQGFAYEPNPANPVDLIRSSNSSAAGDMTLRYVQDTVDIVLIWPFYTVDVYRADPATHGQEFIVARAGSSVNLLTSAQTGLPCHEANGSGLTGMSLDLNEITPPPSTPPIAKIAMGYRKGDTLTFKTTSGDEGRFQTFCRDNFAKALPAAAEHQILEKWAGAEPTVRMTAMLLDPTGISVTLTGGTDDCLWDFGDGNTGSGLAVNHTYSGLEDPNVTLTVTAVDDGAESIVLRPGVECTMSVMSLDCSGMRALKEIDAGGGSTDLRAIPTGCPGLETFKIENSVLEAADFRLLSSLKTLSMVMMQALPEELDLSPLDRLTDLTFNCYYSSELDLSSLTTLTRLDCSCNRFETLDVSDLTELTYLDCSQGNGALTTLTLSIHGKLAYVNCDGTLGNDANRDAILSALAAGAAEHDIRNGFVDVAGWPVGSAGLAAATFLHDIKGWTTNYTVEE